MQCYSQSYVPARRPSVTVTILRPSCLPPAAQVPDLYIYAICPTPWYLCTMSSRTSVNLSSNYIAGYSFLFENLTLPQLKKGRPSTYYVEILSSKFNCLC